MRESEGYDDLIRKAKEMLWQDKEKDEAHTYRCTQSSKLLNCFADVVCLSNCSTASKVSTLQEMKGVAEEQIAKLLGGCMVSPQCEKKRSADGTHFGGQCVFVFALPSQHRGGCGWSWRNGCGELKDLLGGLEDQGWCLACGVYGHTVAICPFQDEEEEPAQERKAGRRSRKRRRRGKMQQQQQPQQQQEEVGDDGWEVYITNLVAELCPGCGA
ncbi:UNVERIFIED_CONTAM: hypothetical protein FKN15_056446 [Acipenser sinensis]